MEEKTTKRNFKGVWIPKAIWLNTELSIMEKCLLTEIDSLDNEFGCIAGNKHFADFFGVSPRQISKYISRLEDKKLIKIYPIGRNKRRIVMEQRFNTDRTNVPSADRTKVPHSNTLLNNTTTITYVSSEDDKTFNFKEILDGMLISKRRDIQIIAFYWRFKRFMFQNRQQYQSALKRELRASTSLVGYSNERLEEVMNYLEDETNFKWGLETISKYIDEDLSNIPNNKTYGGKGYKPRT